MSLSVKILLGMVLGIALGSYLGYALPGVEVIGKAFVMFLQMTALPYVAVSLIYGIGLLSQDMAKSLLKFGSVTFLLLVGIVSVIILLAPVAFPDWTSASFYSANVIQEKTKTDFLSLFIPANPFASFANGMVPAVVVFSVLLGIGFMTVRHRKLSLHLLRDIQNSIGNVSGFIMKMAPIGVFCIAQNAAGTIVPDELEGLIVYLVTVLMIVVLLTFVILPGLVSMLTPLSFRQIIKASGNALITAFATGNLFIVLPIISENIKGLLAEYMAENDPAENVPEVVVSISYSLPTGGKLLSIFFIIFAGWFTGENVPVSDYPLLLAAGTAYLFGSSFTAVPELLEMFNVSASMFDMFVISDNLVVAKMGSMLAVMFCVSLTLLVCFAVMGKIRLYWKPIARMAVAVPVTTLALLYGLSSAFQSMSHQYQGYDRFIDRTLLFPAAEHNVLDKPALQFDAREGQMDTLKRIKKRGLLRVGYYRDSLPYAFHNKEGELVGLDVELMHMLARELGVKVEFVRVYHDETTRLLESGYLDIAGGIPLIPENMSAYTLTKVYTYDTVAIVVKDTRRAEFRNWADFIDRKDLTIGIPEMLFFHEGIRQHFQAPTVWELSTPRIFFRDDKPIDAMIYGAAGGSAWTLIYPEYGIVVPQPPRATMPLAFPIARNDYNFELFMRNWIDMKKSNGDIDRLFSFWIEGKREK